MINSLLNPNVFFIYSIGIRSQKIGLVVLSRNRIFCLSIIYTRIYENIHHVHIIILQIMLVRRTLQMFIYDSNLTQSWLSIYVVCKNFLHRTPNKLQRRAALFQHFSIIITIKVFQITINNKFKFTKLLFNILHILPFITAFILYLTSTCPYGYFTVLSDWMY